MAVEQRRAVHHASARERGRIVSEDPSAPAKSQATGSAANCRNREDGIRAGHGYCLSAWRVEQGADLAARDRGQRPMRAATGSRPSASGRPSRRACGVKRAEHTADHGLGGGAVADLKGDDT